MWGGWGGVVYIWNGGGGGELGGVGVGGFIGGGGGVVWWGDKWGGEERRGYERMWVFGGVLCGVFFGVFGWGGGV
uniref:Uncharacterized protein n=1 Tax=Knipowitschia caucasica TaxID=637954 RepID=A0AAV2KWN7_KNICA